MEAELYTPQEVGILISRGQPVTVRGLALSDKKTLLQKADDYAAVLNLSPAELRAFAMKSVCDWAVNQWREEFGYACLLADTAELERRHAAFASECEMLVVE